MKTAIVNIKDITNHPTMRLDAGYWVKKSNQLAECEIVYKSKVKPSDRAKINNSKDSYEIFKTLWNPDNIEHIESAVVLLLNRGNKVLGWCKISSGGVSGTVVDKKVIFQLALNANASAIILCHNHPSGNQSPSGADLKLTKEIKEACKLLDMELLDHIIITSEGYTSLQDDGQM